MRSYLGLFFIAALFSLLVTPAVRTLGQWLRAYGQADEGREQPHIPRLGGLAILVAALAAWGVLLFVPNDVRARFLSEWRTMAVLMAPGTLVLLLGVYDDLMGATPWQKLIIETLAAGMVWWAGFRIVHLPIFGYGIHSLILSLAVTVFWIVAMTNSFNLIDGLDGLAAGIAFFVTLSVFVVSLIQGNHFGCILAITLAGALLGFLRFNFSPATIFLGDTGSLFLGFVLATLAIHTSQKSSTLLAIVVPFVAFGLPVLDTLLTVVRRFLSGRPLFVGDHDHIHHRLLQRLSPRAAALVLYALTALFSLGSLLIIHSTGNLVALVAVLAGVSGWFLTSRLHYEELSELNAHVSQALHSQRKVLANQILIRKVSGQLKEAKALEGSWQVLVKALEALDFDGVTCQLSGWQNGSTPFLAPWSRPSENKTGDCWTVSIPLRVGEKAIGQLQLRRALSKERLIFHFSSLLDTLIPPFEKQVKRRYDSEEANLVIMYTVEEDLAFRPNLLANGRNG
ncbi:MAG TPA: MraY family glycosyltransferase [Candidatus Limnocylindria bacterium]|nr:MraY family glycosyltransferase [Candidatus Limnocylindria bacterium]